MIQQCGWYRLLSVSFMTFNWHRSPGALVYIIRWVYFYGSSKCELDVWLHPTSFSQRRRHKSFSLAKFIIHLFHHLGDTITVGPLFALGKRFMQLRVTLLAIRYQTTKICARLILPSRNWKGFTCLNFCIHAYVGWLFGNLYSSNSSNGLALNRRSNLPSSMAHYRL